MFAIISTNNSMRDQLIMLLTTSNFKLKYLNRLTEKPLNLCGKTVEYSIGKGGVCGDFFKKNKI